jgi:hypothetical protein
MNGRDTYAAPPSVMRLQSRALLAGILGLALCALGAFTNPAQFFRSYLLGYLFALGLALGCLGLVMMQHLTGGHWAVVIRRPLESATRTLPLLFILFLPLLFGVRRIYGWARPGAPAASRFQTHWLTPSAFFLRFVIYFAIWLMLMALLNRWSREQDGNPDRAILQKMRRLSAPGIILYVLTMTFAALDWIMSLNTQFDSTIFGFILVGGQVVSAMSLMIAVLVLLARSEPMSRVVQPRHLHSLGKLLFAFLMLWAYFAFSQLLIVWSGNLPEEISFYTKRLQTSWFAVSVLILLFHFAVPFLLLLSRDIKRNARLLVWLAIWVMVMRAVDLFWLTAPEFSPLAFHVTWLDFAAPIGIGGLWLAYFARQLRDRPLLPLGDPNLAAAIEHHEH